MSNVVGPISNYEVEKPSSSALEQHSLSDRKENDEVSKRDSAAQIDMIESAQNVDGDKLLRKVDWYLIPWFSLLYLLSFLDRSAIGNARLYGLEKDIHITDKQYLLALTVFYFSYALLEAPSNLILKKVKPHIWLSSLMFSWGICMTLQGTVSNYGGLVTLRFFLGFFEAGLFPGIAFYLSCWYRRSQLGLRIALFYSAATVSGAFGGLLAAAISKMEGVGGKHAWSWIFFIEGLATIVVAVASFWVIDDFPETARFLTEAERKHWIDGLQKEGQNSAAKEPFNMKFVWQAVFDYKTWCAMLIFGGFDGALYAFSLFTPSIINKARFHANIANLLSVPIYAWACIITCIVGYIGDKYSNIRGYLSFIFFGIGMSGYIILIASRKPALSYFAIYLAACGIYPTTPTVIAWVSANTEGPLKRSIVLAMCLGFGNINGAISSNVYRARDAPWYRLGHGIILIYISLGFIASITYWLICHRENAWRESGKRGEVIRGIKGGFEKNGTFDSVEEARLQRGDNWSGYRYVY